MKRLAAWGFLAAALAAVLVLTLTPGSPADRVRPIGFCLICGQDGLANLLRNVLLFVPLGIALGLVSRRAGVVWLLAVLLSATIEGVQILLPGRNPLLADLAGNAAGAGIGVLTAGSALRRLRARATGGASSATAAVGWLLAASAVLVGTGAAFRPAPPEPPHHAQWTARLGHLAPYGGTLVAARLDGRDVPQGRHPDPAWLEAALLGGGTLELEMIAGPPTSRTAPVFSVFTAQRRELFLLGVSGKDVVVHLPVLATRARLDRPDLRVAGALASVQEGEALIVGFRQDASGACVRVQEEEACGLRPTVGEGWALLLFPRRLGSAGRGLLTAIWLLGLTLPVGFFAPDGRRAAVAAATVPGVALLVAASPWFPVGAPAHELLLLVLGVSTGFALQLVGLRLVSVRPEDTLVAHSRHAPRFVPDRGRSHRWGR